MPFTIAELMRTYEMNNLDASGLVWKSFDEFATTTDMTDLFFELSDQYSEDRDDRMQLEIYQKKELETIFSKARDFYGSGAGKDDQNAAEFEVIYKDLAVIYGEKHPDLTTETTGTNQKYDKLSETEIDEMFGEIMEQ